VSVLLLEFENREASALQVILDAAGFDVNIAATFSSIRVQPRSAVPGAVLVANPTGGGEDAAVVCGELRRSGYRGAVIVVGGRPSAGAGVAALEAGADDFISSPVEALNLVARVRAVLRRVVVQVRVAWAPLELDRSEGVVYLRGRPLSLTQREYALLAALLEAQGETVPRSDLAGHLRARAREPRSNAVDVHVSRLRAKLGGDGLVIETVWRRGYRLRETSARRRQAESR
jgi:DNA-binding response OmpR family regulator